MGENLPELWAMDQASKAIGYKDWNDAARAPYIARQSIVGHARTIAKYERTPIDPDLIWAREIASNYDDPLIKGEYISGRFDDSGEVAVALLARKACREEWGLL